MATTNTAVDPDVQALQDAESQQQKSNQNIDEDPDITALKNADPKLADPLPEIKKGTTTTTTTAPKQKSSMGAGEVVGSLAGAAIGSRVPAYKSPDLTAAKARLTGIESELGVANKTLEAEQAAHANTLDQIIKQHQSAQSTLESARDELNAARQAANDLGVLPAAESTIAELAPGTSEIPGSLSQGALRHSGKMGEIVEANAVRKGISGSKAGLPSSQRVPLTGYTQSSRLIVPHELASAPVHTPDQLSAMERLKQAEDAHAQAIKDSAAAEALKNKHVAIDAPQPKSLTSAKTAVNTAQQAKAGAQAALEELDKARSFLSKIPGFNMIMGGLSGAELIHAYNEIQKGNTTEGVLAGLTGVGGLVGMIPSPYTKAIGFGLTLPGLAYQGYHAMTDKTAPDKP
jgi:hypothetical protein